MTTTARVALLLGSDGPGGAEIMLRHLANGLHAEGFTVVPYGPDNGCGWLAERLTQDGFEPAHIRLERPIDLRGLVRLTRSLRRNQIDLVHSHDFATIVYGAVASYFLRVPHLITMHGGTYYQERLRRRAAVKLACRLSGGVVAVSEHTGIGATNALGLKDGDVSIIWNGVGSVQGNGTAIREVLGVSKDEILITAVGSLYPVKGYDCLVEAAAEMPRRGADNWHIVIAGEGLTRGLLTEKIRAFGLTDNVSLLGHRDDIPDLLAASDILVMPSLSEGMPLAIIEAMMAGVPVVASRVGGIPEAVRHMKEGLLVDPGDIAGLAEALTSLCRDGELRRKIGISGRRRAVNVFSVENMVGKYLDEYRMLGVCAHRRNDQVSVPGRRLSAP